MTELLSPGVAERVRADRFRAHELLFAHRHPFPFADFHRELVADFWSETKAVIDLGFRECGKTTLVEEALTIAAAEGEYFEPFFYNCVIVCAKEALAAEILQNVKIELEQNDALIAVYDRVRGNTWQTTKITFKSGRCIQAIGRDQSLRGTKHLRWRPDLVIINDFEDENEVLNDDDRKKTLDWVMKVLLRACDSHRRRIRVYDSRTDPQTVPMRLIRDAGWKARFVPVCYLDENGEEKPSWPGHPNGNMEWISSEREMYRRLGRQHIWDQEMMMKSEARTASPFKAEMLRVVARERTWQPVYVMYDPARTIGRKSAMTGKAVWSWIGRKLVVWNGSAHFWLPDQLIDDVFQTAEIYDPVWVMVEEDGLNEWIRTPIRDEIARRGHLIPYKGVKAPKDKISFIQSLQLYFEGGDIEFAAEFPELRAQLLNFPRPPIDAPNALAYALITKPGHPIYDNFSDENVVLELGAARWHPVYLAANAADGWVAAGLLQMVDGAIRILADIVLEGLPEDRCLEIAQWSAMAVDVAEQYRAPTPRGYEALKNPMAVLDPPTLTRRGKAQWVIPALHFDKYLNIGLLQAISRLPARPQMGGDDGAGRDHLRMGLAQMAHGQPAVQVAENARWTLRALAGGYCRGKNVEPEPGPYRTLMAGIQACIGAAALTQANEDEEQQNYSYDRDGRAYKSIVPQRERKRANGRPSA